MSTKALREALDLLAMQAPDTCDEVSARVASAAWVELAAIEQAAKDLTRLSLGEGVYKVLDSDAVICASGDPWKHPNVKAWSDASSLLATIAEEGK